MKFLRSLLTASVREPVSQQAFAGINTSSNKDASVVSDDAQASHVRFDENSAQETLANHVDHEQTAISSNALLQDDLDLEDHHSVEKEHAKSNGDEQQQAQTISRESNDGDAVLEQSNIKNSQPIHIKEQLELPSDGDATQEKMHSKLFDERAAYETKSHAQTLAPITNEHASKHVDYDFDLTDKLSTQQINESELAREPQQSASQTDNFAWNAEKRLTPDNTQQPSDTKHATKNFEPPELPELDASISQQNKAVADQQSSLVKLLEQALANTQYAEQQKKNDDVKSARPRAQENSDQLPIKKHTDEVDQPIQHDWQASRNMLLNSLSPNTSTTENTRVVEKRMPQVRIGNINVLVDQPAKAKPENRSTVPTSQNPFGLRGM